VRHSGRCAVLAGGNRPERLKCHTVKEIAPEPGECSEKCAECNGRGARGVPDFEKYCRGSTRPAKRIFRASQAKKTCEITPHDALQPPRAFEGSTACTRERTAARRISPSSDRATRANAVSPRLKSLDLRSHCASAVVPTLGGKRCASQPCATLTTLVTQRAACSGLSRLSSRRCRRPERSTASTAATLNCCHPWSCHPWHKHTHAVVSGDAVRCSTPPQTHATSRQRVLISTTSAGTWRRARSCTRPPHRSRSPRSPARQSSAPTSLAQSHIRAQDQTYAACDAASDTEPMVSVQDGDCQQHGRRHPQQRSAVCLGSLHLALLRLFAEARASRHRPCARCAARSTHLVSSLSSRVADHTARRGGADRTFPCLCSPRTR